MKKLLYAKRLCITTIGLLVLNLLLSSFTFSHLTDSPNKSNNTLISNDLGLDLDDQVFEKELLEEEEEELGDHIADFAIYCSPVLPGQVAYSSKTFTCHKVESSVPRWLMVRHILI